MYVGAPCMCLWRPDSTLGSLELELQVVVSSYVGTGSQTFARAASFLNC